MAVGLIFRENQRFTEIWNALPELYLLIIISAIYSPSILLLVVLFALFGWISLADYIRAEFLRNRGLDFVKGARGMGLLSAQHYVASHPAEFAYTRHHLFAV